MTYIRDGEHLLVVTKLNGRIAWTGPLGWDVSRAHPEGPGMRLIGARRDERYDVRDAPFATFSRYSEAVSRIAAQSGRSAETLLALGRGLRFVAQSVLPEVNHV